MQILCTQRIELLHSKIKIPCEEKANFLYPQTANAVQKQNCPEFRAQKLEPLSDAMESQLFRAFPCHIKQFHASTSSRISMLNSEIVETWKDWEHNLVKYCICCIVKYRICCIVKYRICCIVKYRICCIKHTVKL